MSSNELSPNNPFDLDPCYNYAAPDNVSDDEFLNMLCQACKTCNMEEWDNVVGVCESIRKRLILRGRRNLYTYSLQLKLQCLRNRHNTYDQFKEEDGITFDLETKKFVVAPCYFQNLLQHNIKEKESYKNLRLKGEPLCEKLDFLFHERCCALVPLEWCGLPDASSIIELEDENDFSSIFFWCI